MDTETARILERIETKQGGIVEDISEVKETLRCLNISYLSIEGHNSLVQRVDGIEKKVDKTEANISKAVWIVLSTVIVAVLSLVIIG